MGQHGLPLLSFVPQDEREELMAVFAATVYERGFARTSLQDVADRAGLTPAAITRYWPHELGCLLDTVATSTRQLFARAAIAFMSAEGDGPRALHAALAAILDDAAHAPEMTYMSVIELPRLGAVGHQRHARMTALFSELLAPAIDTMDHPPPDPETLTLGLVGAVWESLRRHAAQRRLHQLPETLPALSQVAIGTLYGREEADRVADRRAQR
jgi:AcrR family transcriptional regulator